MALNIPSFASQFGLTLTNAYAWLAGLSLDISNGTGRVTFNVHPTEVDWQKAPVDQISFHLEQQLVPANPQATPPTAAVTFPSMAELMADTTKYGTAQVTFAQAYEAVGLALYAQAMKAPAFSGATQI